MVITSKALEKACLHSQKYPFSPVFGVFLSEGGESVDALPLSHSYPLGPLIELFMHQVDQLALDRGQHVSGVYFSNELGTDDSLSRYAELLADCISRNAEKQSIFIYRLEGEVYENRKGTWETSTASIELPKANETAKNGIIDFEEYLSNPSMDWKNLVL